MPTYRLKCKGCSKEREQRFTDRFIKLSKEEVEEACNFPCNWCGGKEWEKMPTAALFTVEGGTPRFHGDK